MYRLLATTVLAGVGWLLPYPALAQIITLTPPTPGVLSPPGGVFNQLTTSVPSTIQVTILGGRSATVQVAAPTLSSGGHDPTGTVRTATVTFSGNSVNSGDAAIDFPTGIPTLLNVSMAVTRPTVYTPGTYSYGVIVTITAAAL